jgi:segregation and condensation protein B
MELSLQAQLESLLFWKGEPTSLAELVKLTASTPEACQEALTALAEHLARENRGIVLVSNGTDYELTTAPQMSAVIAELTKDELTRDLSKAALETLSIILYRGPIRRSEIDYIRGVNAQFILRMLSIRGLIVRTSDPNDERAFTYGPSMELLKLLGVDQKESLPDFAQVNADIDGFISSQNKEVAKEQSRADEMAAAEQEIETAAANIIEQAERANSTATDEDTAEQSEATAATPESPHDTPDTVQ